MSRRGTASSGFALGNGGGETMEHLKARAQHTQEVLQRYKEYVETNIQRKLDTYTALCQELQQQVRELSDDRARRADEVNALQRQLRETMQDQDGLVRSSRDEIIAMNKEFRQREDELREAHQAQLASVSHDVAALKKENAGLRESLQAAAAGQSSSEHTAETLRAKDREIERLRREVAALEEDLDTAHEAKVTRSAAVAVEGLESLCSETRLYVKEAAEFHAGLAAVSQHFGADGSDEHSGDWRGILRDAGAVPEGSLEELQCLLHGLFRVAAQERISLSSTMRHIVQQHAALSTDLAQRERERHGERDLHRRRLEELERDRSAEKEKFLIALEQERLVRGSHGGSSGGGAGFGSLAASAGSGHRQYEPVKMVTHSVQTGVDLLESLGGDAVIKLSTEVKSLDNQLATAKAKLAVLERQRSEFLGFLDTVHEPRAAQQRTDGVFGFMSSGV